MAKYRPQLWGYQLQNAKADAIAHSKHDLLVIDFEQNGPRSFTSKQIKQMKAGGAHKIVSYISIGEAEDYRTYWKSSWSTKPPHWLEKENADWDGNYKVRYWDPGWQKITLGRIKTMAKAGYDGAYLDIIDAYEYFEDRRSSAAKDMIDFVAKLAKAARAINPKFMIIPQNGEGLLKNKKYLSLIDGIGKEDLYYGLEGNGVPNSAREVAYSKKLLNLAVKAGKFVLNVEYLSSKAQIKQYMTKVGADGYVPYAGPRDLDKLKHDVPGMLKVQKTPSHQLESLSANHGLPHDGDEWGSLLAGAELRDPSHAEASDAFASSVWESVKNSADRVPLDFARGREGSHLPVFRELKVGVQTHDGGAQESPQEAVQARLKAKGLVVHDDLLL
jgi:cysteinyl-tRNA synthetase, unknown class